MELFDKEIMLKKVGDPYKTIEIRSTQFELKN